MLGVVGDTSVFGIQKSPFPQAYFPVTAALDFAPFGGSVVVKTSGAPAGVVQPLRSNLAALDSTLAAFQPRAMDAVIAEATQSTGVQTYLLGSFAGLALLLGRRGTLQRAGLSGDAAHARDWYPHGAGRAA